MANHKRILHDISRYFEVFCVFCLANCQIVEMLDHQLGTAAQRNGMRTRTTKTSDLNQGARSMGASVPKLEMLEMSVD